MILKTLVNLFFPQVCRACSNYLSDNEIIVCTSCRHDLPVTNFHFNNDKSIHNILRGRAKIAAGTALFRFEKKSNVQNLIHNLKYRGHENIGVFLGDWLGNELKTITPYNTIDVVIPVPLHNKKLKERGFNQVAKFGQHIAKSINANYIDTILLKVTNTKSQVNKKRFARWDKSNELFSLDHMSALKNKHILLVDDIITTGATMEACIGILNQVKNIKISIAVMAIA